MRVSIRGVIYPTVKAAAAAQGVKVKSIYSALEKGTIDNVGLRFRGRKPITLFGTTYESITTASESLNVNQVRLSITINTLKKLGFDFNTGKFNRP